MRKLLAPFFVILLLAGLLAGCGPEKDPVGAKDTCIYAIGTDLTSFDPQKLSDLATKRILLVNVYDPLVRIDNDGELVPAMATDWHVSDDGLEYTFDIRQNVKWHNGDTLSLDDIVFSFQKAKNEPTISDYVKLIKSVEKVSDTQIKMTLSKPYGPFLRTLSLVGLVNKGVYDATGGNYGDDPVGTGPYFIDEYVTGSKTVLKKFDDYWGEPASIGTFEIRVITDRTTRALSIESGDVDVVLHLDPVDLANARNNKDLTVVEGPSLMLVYLGMNQKVEPFKDIKVRQAIARALNIEEINTAAFEGTAIPAKLPLTPYSFGYSDDYAWPGYDLEAAKALMAESKYPNGFETRIATQAGPAERMSEVIQANLSEIGITVKIDTLEFGTLLSQCTSGNFELMTMGHSDPIGDSEYALGMIFSSENHGAAGNMGFYTNKEVDDCLARAKVSADQQERQRLYERVLELAIEDCPIVPLIFEPYDATARANVKGIEFHPLLYLDFKKFRFD